MHLNDPLAFPLRALQFAGLPATIAFVAEIDPICDDGIFYTQRLRAAGVPAQCNLLVDLPHGCIRAWKQISAVQTCWKQMITALETLAKGDTMP